MTRLEAVSGTHQGPTREEVLAAALRPFADELKLIDPAELICLCVAEKHSNINDLIESAAEMFFQRGTLRYAGAVDVEMSWDAPPRLVLDMEFENDKVIVLFRLALTGGPPAVEICHVMDATDIDPLEPAGTSLSSSLISARRNRPCDEGTEAPD